MVTEKSPIGRDAGIVLFGLGILSLTVWLFVAPKTFPAGVRDIFSPMADGTTAMTLGILLGLFVVIVAGVRLWRSAAVSLDRSPITETPPESVTDGSVPSATGRIDMTVRDVDHRFSNPSRPERHVAMYGRRAFHTTQLHDGFERFFDELAVTARDVYATRTGCDEAAAKRAIDDGTWTDDRIAAAYLAWNPEAAPTFTTRERLLAWLAPRRTFEKRFSRIIGEIERQADAYLTYDTEKKREVGEE